MEYLTLIKRRLKGARLISSTDIVIHLSLFEKRFGSLPKRFFGDKIYLNGENRATLKYKGIQIMGPQLGRPPKKSKHGAAPKGTNRNTPQKPGRSTIPNVNGPNSARGFRR